VDIEKELDEILDDPLLNITEKEAALFDLPADMRKAAESKNKADYVAQHRLCEDFERFRPLFLGVHHDLKTGRRSLIRIAKTTNLQAGHYYVVDGQLVLLERVGERRRSSNFLPDARTRCIYENGTEADILLQTLRKNVVGNGYAVTELQEETEKRFFSDADLTEKDQVTGYIYVLRSLSVDPAIAKLHELYKIGFSTNAVEERVANAAHEPTYLMAPVEIVATYKVVNLHSQKFEDIVHQLLKAVQLHVTVVDDKGESHEPKEWFVVPLEVVDAIVERVMDGTIVNYSYNAELQCLEKRIVRQQSTFDTTGLKILTLNIRKVQLDEIVKGVKKVESRELKQTTLNKFTYVDESDGKRYLRRYDALRLVVSYQKDRESALVQVVETRYSGGVVEYHLGMILEHIKNKKCLL